VTTLRDGTTVTDPRLDRLTSQRTDHLEKYPLTTATAPSKATPMLGGFNWYNSCFNPTRRRINGRHYHVIGDTPLGPLRGGHAIAFRPWNTTDLTNWWAYYDQGVEGRCPEFAGLRVLTLMNRKRYDITSRWHYWQMQREDEWAGGSYPGATPHYEGSSVRAALEVLRKYGAIPATRTPLPADPKPWVKPAEGIAAYRWITNWDDARRVSGVPDWMPGIPFLNSWGRNGYPHTTIMLDNLGPRLLHEQGELGVVTDR
jgi:hypothetical protein